MPQGNLAVTETDLDGSFTTTNVPPSDYYVFAVSPGYVQPMTIVRAALDNGADIKKSIPGVPLVHVIADRSAKADLVIDRGAAISGKVLWDDGSPATRVFVSVTSTKRKSKDLPEDLRLLEMGNAMSGAIPFYTTDDLGNFRIAGLAPGDYLVEASLQTRFQFTIRGNLTNQQSTILELPLTVFAPSAFHPADAKPVTQHTAEDRNGEDITIRLEGLHSISGQVASSEDHHALNSAVLYLRDPQDKDFQRSTHIDAHGNFTIQLIPPGTYDLVVMYAADTETSNEKELTDSPMVTGPVERTLRSYATAKQAVIVSENDITGQNIELAPLKPTQQDTTHTEPTNN
jgi:hypothetical protein